jgi:hypothetical protein
MWSRPTARFSLASVKLCKDGSKARKRPENHYNTYMGSNKAVHAEVSQHLLTKEFGMARFFTLSVSCDPDDDSSGSNISQTSATLEGAVAGAVAKLNQAFDKYTEGYPDAAATFPEMVELCRVRDWELRLTIH